MISRLLAFRNHVFQREILPHLSRLRNKPSTVHISITYKCNLSCRMCNLWRTHQGELSTEEWKRVIREFREWLGPYTLKLVGGEPLTRPDIVELLSYAHSLGIYTGISTNGTLIDEKKAEELVSAGLNEIDVSIDSANPASHDNTRNREGTFNKARRGLSHLKKWKGKKKSPISINLAAIINRRNIDELPAMVQFIKTNKLHSIAFQPIMQTFGDPYNPLWFKKSELWPDDPDKVDKVIDELIRLREEENASIGNKTSQLKAFKEYFRNPISKASKNCQAGIKEIALNPDGSLLLCYNLSPVGNVKNESVKQILSGQATKQRRAEITACSRNCNLLNCNYEK